MYVDRKLGGNQAVQTLSRLNRTMPSTGKDITYVDEPADIGAAFWEYHTTARLIDVSDPNVVLDPHNKLDALAYYDQHKVKRVARAVLKSKATQADPDAIRNPEKLSECWNTTHVALRQEFGYFATIRLGPGVNPGGSSGRQSAEQRIRHEY